MRISSRWALVTAAIVLTVAGGIVGWTVAAAHQGTVSDAVVSAIVTGAFTLLGAAIGLLVPLVQEWERNRPNLKLQLSLMCMHASPLGLRMASEIYPSEFSGGTPPLLMSWLRCRPEDPTAKLVVFLDVQIQNRSHLDDAVTEMGLEVPSKGGTSRLPLRLSNGSDFFGESVPAHQLRPIHMRVMLEPENYRDTVNWTPEPDVIWRLVARTINDQTIIDELHPAAHFRAYTEGAIRELDDWHE